MKVLSIDTSTPVCSVAIVDEEKILSEVTMNSKGRNHSERLMTITDQVLKGAGITLEDIDLFSCSIGPGSFTGLRIAISTIKGLAQSQDKPVVGVSTLEALAYNVIGINELICPIMDAQRDQLYAGLYSWSEGGLQIEEEEVVISVDELLSLLKKRREDVVLLGDGVKKISQEVLKDYPNISIGHSINLLPKASSQGALALDLAKKRKTISYSELTPNYMRKSQAELQLEEKLKSKKS